MNVVERAIVAGEGRWAAQHVHLAPEPAGSRSGVARPAGAAGGGPDRVAPAIRMVVLGDSMVAGCGVADQSEGLVPRIAALLAERWEGPVAWEGRGRLGATMRRVR